VALRGAPWDMNPVTDWEQNVAGKPVSIINFWSFWSNGGKFQGFDRAAMDNVRNHGSIPMVTWAPEAGGNATPDQPDFRLINIIEGQYDPQIKVWAGNAKLWGHPFFLRFAHEPDGNWFPWGEDANGNQRGQYVQAWRHVHDLFTAAGAANVTWVWCMNEGWAGAPRPSYASLYPGDNYVDWSCLDGYNWGTRYGAWRSFDTIFRWSYDTLVQVAPTKPMMLGEWASVGTGGSLGAWITDAFTVQIPTNYPQIRAEVWYNFLTSFDWRVESWPGAPESLRAALSSSKYRGAEFGGLSNTPIPAP
jgi:mannan endo-1,4-beta-mannosidase